MTQESRQAIIELLLLSIYTDDHLSLAEDAVLNQAIETLNWESEEPREEFLSQTFALVRETHPDTAKTQEFFVSRAQAIKAEGCQGEALTWLTKVLGSDGFSATETYVLRKLENIWYPG
ncbi:hypothetical protein JIN85_00195 [Luteolibacter pohnpeiensis]|uniref:Co-chaperone DjlA N-terminal domain-containing protein n=1 Tax=Luteolibacter pohnpeiensis TaxID=454153 RepID=A0A934S7J6_9BACT|nr:hypothetical protein [Luteolibacter pohnpeiensis]MBK1880809.1 hypothetical protein [Luteolibacter pohnpeiensis]